MPGLADLILAENDEDEDSFDDEELKEQLAALQARKAALLAGASSPEVAPLPPGPAAPAGGTPGRTVEAVRGHVKAVGKSTGFSLATAILEASEEGDPVDKELEAMESDLQKKMEEYLKNCQGAGEEPPAFATAASVSAPPRAAAAAARPEPPRAAPNTCEAELLAMKDHAAKLEQAFPEPAAEDPPERIRPRLQLQEPSRGLLRETDLGSVPVETEVGELFGALEQLDMRLRAIQNREELLEVPQRPTPDEKPETKRAIAELQAQNAHLRERFGAAGDKGVLKLDRGLFPVQVRGGASDR